MVLASGHRGRALANDARRPRDGKSGDEIDFPDSHSVRHPIIRFNNPSPHNGPVYTNIHTAGLVPHNVPVYTNIHTACRLTLSGKESNPANSKFFNLHNI